MFDELWSLLNSPTAMANPPLGVPLDPPKIEAEKLAAEVVSAAESFARQHSLSVPLPGRVDAMELS